MKYLILAFTMLALTLSNAFAINGTLGRSSALKYDGSVVPESREKISINVKNTYSSAFSRGQVVVADLTAKDGVSAVLSTTATQPPLCVMEVACAVGALCPCQTYGFFDGALFDVTAASAVAGKRLYISTSVAGSIAARGTDLVSEPAGGFFYEAASATGSVKVFLKM